MKKNLIRFAALAALATVSAVGQTFTVNYSNLLSTSFTGTPTPSGGVSLDFVDQAVTLPQWNPASFPSGATLTGVQYRFASYAYIDYAINNGNQEANFSVALNLPGSAPFVAFNLTGPAGSSPAITRGLLDGGYTTLAAVSLSIPLVAPNTIVSGTTPIGSSTMSSFFSDAANLATYQGSGTVTFLVDGQGVLAINGSATSGSPTVSFTQSASKFGGGLVEVQYTYQLTEVPEPSTYAAMGFVGLVAGATIWRRRQMAKKA
jgi:hypothetical protein